MKYGPVAMAKIEVDIEPTNVVQNGVAVPGLSGTCGDCDHTIEIACGKENEEATERRLLCQFRLQCKLKERHTYVKVT